MKKLLFPLFTLVLNLQLFADNVMTTLLPGMAPEMKTHYDNTLIDVVSPALVHGQLAQKRPIPKGSGKRIEFRRYLSLAKAMTPLTEGIPPAGNSLTVITIEAEIAQYGDFIRLSDMLELTAIDDNIVQATKALGNQAGETLDTVTRNAMHKGTNVSYAPRFDENGNEIEVLSRKDLDMTAKISIDFVEQQVAKLKAANAPKIDGKYVAIVHPFITYQLRRDPEWIKTHDYKSDVKLFENEVGEWCGVRFIESTLAKIYCGDNLAEDSRTLKFDGRTGSNSFSVTGGTITPDSLVGRKILINGVKYTVANNSATALSLTEDYEDIAEGTVIYPGEGGAEGVAVFGCLFLGDNAYGETEITGGGLEVILKQLGSGGASGDPLNQVSSVGWKATKTATILVEEYIIRAECTCKYSTKIFKAN